MAHPVTWFQITGTDGRKLHAFYKKVFGWRMKAAPGPGDLQIVHQEEDGISGGVGSAMDGAGGVTVYVNVADVGAHLKKVEAAGGRAAMPPMELPSGMGWIAGFIDPAGNWVGLWAPGAGARPAKKAPAKRAPAKQAKPPSRPRKPAKKPGPARAKAAKKRARRS
jgi:uncharacterized protein